MSLLPAYANSVSHEKKVVDTVFVNELNVNKSSKNQIVQFKTTESYSYSNGLEIPKSTIIVGKISSIKKGRWAYRRAKAKIVLTEIRLPDGTTYQINGNTKKKVLKGSAIGNVGKGIITLPVALVVGAGGTCLMLLECVSIFGIVLLVPTGVIIAGTCGKLSNGINCVKHAGDAIKVEYNLK